MDDVLVIESADDLADGIGFPDRGKELVAKPLTL